MASEQSDADSRLEALLDEYQQSLETDTPMSREQILADHPQWTPQLRAFFELHDRLNAAAITGRDQMAAKERSQDELGLQGLELPEGTAIGPYRLLEVIGRGGMGVVYRAQQTVPVHRQLAIKLIRPGLEARSIVARFEAERQALAIMDHPNIARVIDGGVTERGQPFFAMELVSGLPINQYCDQHRLNLRQRLELMIPVCHAVQHAHQKGIIHRDLKPSNILVTELDGQPIAKVIDFGLAKAIGTSLTDQSLHTDIGAILGTLEYMSPEQAGLHQVDIDTRSDIYSLGVILYELLTGTTPVEKSSLQRAVVMEVLRIIREVEPPLPSSRVGTAPAAPSISANRSIEPARLRAMMRGELDWIVMKALDKERDRRYETAAALAGDLNNYLSDAPVAAGPPSRWYRVRKAIRRNRGLAVALGLLVAILVAGAGGTTWGMLQARAAQAEARRALDATRRERDQKMVALEAERSARLEAEEASHRAMTALQSLTDESVQRLLATQSHLSDDTRAFMTSIIQQLEDVSQTSQTSVSARAVQADGLHRIGVIKWELGDLKGAVAAYQQAIDVWQLLCRESADLEEYRRGMADSYSNLGIALASLREFPQSEQAHRQAIALHEQLVAEFPSRHEYRRDLANCRASFGVMLKDVKRNVETIEQYRMAIELQKELVAQHPTNDQYQRRLAGTMNNLGLELKLAGESNEALQVLREVLAARLSAGNADTADHESQLSLAQAYFNLGLLEYQTGSLQQGLENVRSAGPIYAGLAARFPALIAYRQEWGNMLGAYGQMLNAAGQIADSQSAIAQYVDVHRQLAREQADQPTHWNCVAKGQLMRGKLLIQLKRMDEAETALQDSIASYQTYLDTSSEDTAALRAQGEASLNLGQLLASQQRVESALEYLSNAIERAERSLNIDPQNESGRRLSILAHRMRARLLMDRSEWNRAADDWDQVLQYETDETQRTSARLSRARCGLSSDVQHAIEDVRLVTADGGLNGAQWYLAARVLSLASSLVEESDREGLVQQAIDCLIQAKAADYFKTQPGKAAAGTDSDLAPLRDHIEFQSILDD